MPANNPNSQKNCARLSRVTQETPTPAHEPNAEPKNAEFAFATHSNNSRSTKSENRKFPKSKKKSNAFAPQLQLRFPIRAETISDSNHPKRGQVSNLLISVS